MEGNKHGSISVSVFDPQGPKVFEVRLLCLTRHTMVAAAMFRLSLNRLRRQQRCQQHQPQGERRRRQR